MFNLLVHANDTAWESEQRMGMPANRFLEHSGDESVGLSIDNMDSLRRLERVQTLLMYEDGGSAMNTEVVRVGQIRSIRVDGGEISFRFRESGRLERSFVIEHAHRIQLERWERTRTHWAVKDGDIPQDILRRMTETPRRYDIVLSYAGEDREYVEQVAEFLSTHSVEVFFDRFEQATLWGKDLPEHLSAIYRQQARFCVMFISTHYARKMWPRAERRAAFARAIHEQGEYILPARFDGSELPGLNPSVCYVDLREINPQELGQLILEKLGRA